MQEQNTSRLTTTSFERKFIRKTFNFLTFPQLINWRISSPSLSLLIGILSSAISWAFLRHAQLARGSQSSRIILIQQLVKLVHTITHLTTLYYSNLLTCNNLSLEGSPAFYKMGNWCNDGCVLFYQMRKYDSPLLYGSTFPFWVDYALDEL